MKNFINNNIKVSILLISVISISLLGTTLALALNAMNITVSTGNYGVVYSGTATLPSAKLEPILDANLLATASASKIMKVNFTVKGASSNPTDRSIIYDVTLTNLSIPSELKNEYFKWRLYKNDSLLSSGTFSPSFDSLVNNRMVLTTIQQDLPSYSSTADSYTFYIWISDKCTGAITTCTSAMDQSSMMNKTFSGEIRIELSTKSKKTLVRPTS